MKGTQMRANHSDLAFRAMRKIARAISVHSSEMAKRHGLTTPQIAVMREVCDAGKLPVSQIAARTSLSHATVSGILDRLERGGYLERVRDHSDRRCVNIRMTAAGRNEMDRTPPLLKQGFVSAFAELPEWEQMALLSALERIAAMMTGAE
jgi:DNA-binding MarR family transcriptional regulator